MRLLVAALAALLVLNATMASMRRSLTQELAALESRHAERAKTAERTATEAGRERARKELIDRARDKGLPRHLGVGALRDLLIGAERGLAIDRISLEFRPAQASGSVSNGSQVSAALVGSFEGLFDYLDRIESLRLPLAPQELSFQRNATGALGLTIRWTALWSEARRAGHRRSHPRERVASPRAASASGGATLFFRGRPKAGASSRGNGRALRSRSYRACWACGRARCRSGGPACLDLASWSPGQSSRAMSVGASWPPCGTRERFISPRSATVWVNIGWNRSKLAGASSSSTPSLGSAWFSNCLKSEGSREECPRGVPFPANWP